MIKITICKYENMKKDILKAGELVLENVKVHNEKLYLDGKKNFIIKPILTNKNGENIFNSTSIKGIAENIKKITNKRYMLKKLNIYLDISKVDIFEDKNTYILLDLLLFYLMVNTRTNKKIFINIGDFRKFDKTTSIGIYNTAFMRTLVIEKANESKFNNNMLDRETFISKYLKATKSYSEEYKEHLNHSVRFSRYIITESIFEESELDKITTNIYHELNHSFGSECTLEWIDEVTTALGEILSNSYTHNKLFTIIDIDIPNLQTIDNEKELSIGLNVSIVNIGKETICNKMCNGILNKKFNEDAEIYQKVFKAYKNHISHFQDKDFKKSVNTKSIPYTLQHFLLITAFQERVTTRYLGTEYDTGEHSGVGLTELIKNIQEKTKAGLSYVMTEDVSINFVNELLTVNSDGTIGFNKTNNYIDDIPDEDILGIGDFYIPGTLYQLHLILESCANK